jgi:hypothetical protein
MHVIKKSWFRKIRTGNWFSYRYYWFVFLAFIVSSISIYYFLFKRNQIETCETQSLEIIGSINSAFESCCKCGTPEEGLHFPADYLIITYQFSSLGGKDLDTRTGISSPINAGPLGYCDRGTFGDPYIFWSGDNTGTGVESCMIDLTKFNANDVIQINCSGLWWSLRNNGDMSLDIKAYEGGTMSLHGYQFVNTGGQQSAETSFSGNVHASGGRCESMESIGTITYNKRNKTLQFDPINSLQTP